jgi:glycosyltransferase involved in cell wall biosynthesis
MQSKTKNCFGFFLDSPFFSGAEMQIEANILDLAKSVEVTVFLFGSKLFIEEVRGRLEGKVFEIVEHVIERNDKNKNRISEKAHDLLTQVRAAFWAFSRIRRRTFGLVHVNNGGYPGSPSSRGFACGALLASKQRTLLTVNNMTVPYRASLARILDWPTDRFLSSSRLEWITGSDAAGRALEEVLKLQGSKRQVIPNGVSLPACTCKNSIGCSYSAPITGNPMMFLTIGHLEHRKGHDVLLGAIAALRERGALNPNWKFLIEGIGPLFDNLDQEIQARGLAGSVLLLGRADCLRGLYERADVLIHPSRSQEDLPNVISEALGFGIPVIASQIAGIPEQIDHSVEGLLVAPENPEELAGAIERLGLDAPLRVKMGAAGKIKYNSKFTKTRALAMYRGLYGLRE